MGMKNTSAAPIMIGIVLLGALLVLLLAGLFVAGLFFVRTSASVQTPPVLVDDLDLEDALVETLQETVAETVEELKHQEVVEALTSENESLREQVEQQKERIEQLESRNRELLDAWEQGLSPDLNEKSKESVSPS